MDPNQMIEGIRPNIHVVDQLDVLDEDWLSMSPQRDDLKLLCEQNVRAWDGKKADLRSRSRRQHTTFSIPRAGILSPEF